MEQLKVIMWCGGGVCVFWGWGVGEAVEKADRDCAWVQRAKETLKPR